MPTQVLPTFKTGRLIVRPRTLSDLEDCMAMDRDPSVTHFIPGPWADPAAHREFVLSRMNCNYPKGLGYWSVIKRGGPQTFLGWILLIPYHEVGDETEIGWRLTRDSWGNGFATEAATPVLHHAFSSVGLGFVVADIDQRNAASIRVAEKLGMQLAEDRILDGIPYKSYQIRANQV